MDEAIQSLIGVVTLVIIMAIVVVLVSKKSSTVSVVNSFSSAFASLLGRATKTSA